MMIKRITKGDLFRIFLKSFYIQGSWNYQRFQSLGFYYAIFHISKRLFSDINTQKEFTKRNLCLFNAHPYLASYALGALTKLEEQLSNDQLSDPSKLEHFKQVLCGPLGALGDDIFWRLIKPVSALVGVIVTLAFGLNQSTALAVVGPVVFLLIYNVPHLYYRMAGIFQGYKAGFDLTKLLAKRPFKYIILFYSTLGLFSLGILISYCSKWALTIHWSLFLLFIFSFGLTVLFLKRSINIMWIIIIFLGLTAIFRFTIISL